MWNWRASETFADTILMAALGHLKLDVVAGEQNPADTLTKPLPGRKIRDWSELVGQRWLQQSQQQQQQQ